VCSLEQREGERAIDAFLQAHANFSRSPIHALPGFVPVSEGAVRILPGLLEAEGGLDGFFIAPLVRRS